MEYWNYLLLAALWIGYCALHSALISLTFTNFIKKTLGDKCRYHRIFFNLFSLAGIVPLLVFSAGFRFQPFFAWSGNLRILQYALIALAAVLFLGGAGRYSMSQFLGIQQIQGKSGKGLTKGGELDSTGMLGVVRHPWYLAAFILLWTGDLTPATTIINVILSGYLLIGTLLEERKLVLEFGNEYRRYQNEVSMFIPLKWVKSKIHMGRVIFPPKNSSYTGNE